LDFTGTPAAPFSLNAQLTFAACLSALTKILLSKHQLLAGLSHSLNVIAPENTFVNGGPIASVYGIYEGAAWIEQAICQAFSQYSPQYQTAQHGLSGCPVIFRFPMHSPLFIISPLGMAGSVVYRGRNAVYIGNDPTNIFNVMSLEDGQNPIQLRSFHLRRNSGGKGKHSGGCGFVQTFSIQQDGEIEWVYSDERAKGALGGKAGTSAALQVRRGQREWEDLPTQGLQSISPGDEISILSSGGGGFGPPGSVT
jgi:N-methylhydantoinase B/oxoprolinase/acetone carboxylase alpha subunit